MIPKPAVIPKTAGRRAARLLVGALATAFALSGLARAQSNFPARRQGTMRFTAQYLHLGDQLFSEGSPQNEGTTKTYATVLSADYGLSNRLALFGTATYIQTRYEGPIPHGSYDDGEAHGTPQDASLTLLWKALPGTYSIVPFLGYVVPMANYETRGLAAAGRGLNQTIVGVDLGWEKPSSPFTVHVVYAYRFVEKLDGINTDRRHLGISLGYQFQPRLSGSLFAGRRSSPGGYDLITDATEPNFMQDHDAAIALEENDAGIGLTWTVSPSIDLYGAYSETLSGANLQETRDYTAGLAWHFGGNPRLGN